MKMNSRYGRLLNDVKLNTKIDGMGPFKKVCIMSLQVSIRLIGLISSAIYFCIIILYIPFCSEHQIMPWAQNVPFMTDAKYFFWL